MSEGEDGRILVKCHYGCSTKDIVSAMGLTLQDLFPAPEKKPEKKAAAKPEETAGEGRSTRVPGRSIRILISSVPDPQKKADRKGRTKGQ